MPAPLPLSPRTHCPYCAFQCATRLIRRELKKVEVVGDETFPVNRGELCIKGLTAGALLDRPDRLLSPLVRSKSGEMVPSSWALALDVLAERLQQLRRRHGPDSVAVFGSGALTNEKAYALGKFARLVLGTRHIDYNGRFCMASAAGALNRALGLDRGLPFPVEDIRDADCVVSWGSNWADTLPPIARWFTEQRRRGGQQIVVDPRATATAQQADLHLQLTPGSDLALANGMLHVAIEEGLVDEAYIAERTEGFSRVKQVVGQYWPGRVEQLTGVAEPRLRRAVRMVAHARRSMLLSGRGPEQQSKGVDTVLAFINLMLALGKLGIPGSGYGCLTGQGNGQGGREHGQKADQLPGYRSITDPACREAVAKAWGVRSESLPGAGYSAVELLDALGPLKSDGSRGIRGLLVMGSNVAVAAPNATSVRQRLGELDLLVVCDSFLNETSETADIVLPVLQWAEEEGTVTNFEGRVLLRSRILDAPPGPRSDLWVLRELARRLGDEHYLAFGSEAEVFAELARVTAGARADYSGMSHDRLRGTDGLFWPCPDPTHPGTPRVFLEGFAHPDGRARFIPVEHREAAELPDREYPYYFTTGRVREHYNSGTQTRGVGALKSRAATPTVDMHPRLIARLGLSEDQEVVVRSRRGSARFRVARCPTIRPDTLFAPFHWGGSGSANRLTNPALDPSSRMPEFKVCAVAVGPPRSRSGSDVAEPGSGRCP